MPIITPPTSGSQWGPYFTLTAEVVNATWDMANVKSTAMTNKVQQLTGPTGFLNTTDAPQINAGSAPIPIVQAPNVDIPHTLEVADVMSTYSVQYQELIQTLEQKFTEFITTHFPDEHEAYALLEEKLNDALQNGGLSEATEDRIYDSQRGEILEDASRAADATLATFASRRFAVPPGAALAAVREIQQKAQSEISKAGGAIAALKVEMEKFTIEKIMAQRQMALSSALDYIKALVSAPDVSSKMTGVGYDAQAKLIAAAADFYRTDIAAAELGSKVEQFNTSAQLESASKNQAATLALIDAKVKVLLGELQMLSQEATSLFNNLNASVGVNLGSSDSLSTSHNYNYEM